MGAEEPLLCIGSKVSPFLFSLPAWNTHKMPSHKCNVEPGILNCEIFGWLFLYSAPTGHKEKSKWPVGVSGFFKGAKRLVRISCKGTIPYPHKSQPHSKGNNS